MYRSTRKREEIMPSSADTHIPSFMQLPDSPSASSPSSIAAIHQTFLERFTGLPLVRAAVERVQDVYEKTKERNGRVRALLETGETTVTYSLTRAADVLTKTGLTQRLQKPLSLVDSSACYVLDKVEEKLPIIAKSPYEIKLMISDGWEAKRDQVNAYKETSARLLDDCKTRGTQTVEEAKRIAEEKLVAVLDTPVGQKFNQTLERTLSLADTYVDRYLPEGGHSHKNGNGTANGHHINSNGFHTGTMEHAKSLSRKLKHRVSARSTDVVDSAVEKYPIVKKVVGAVQQGRVLAKVAVARAKEYAVTGLAWAVDTTFNVALFFVPGPFKTRVTVFADGLVDKIISAAQKTGFAAKRAN